MITTLEGKNMKICLFIDPVSAHIWGQGAPFSQVWMVGLSPDAADVDHHQVWFSGKKIENTNRCYKIQVGGWWNIETDANYFEADTCWCTRHFVLLVWNLSFTRDRRSADFSDIGGQGLGSKSSRCIYLGIALFENQAWERPEFGVQKGYSSIFWYAIWFD